MLPETATIAITGATRKRPKTTVSTGSLRIAITVNQTVAANRSWAANEWDRARNHAYSRRAAIAAERKALLLSRPDLPPSLVASLAKESCSIETVREIVADHPRGVLPNPAAAATAVGTRGAGQGGAAGLTLSETTEMDIAMGLAKAPNAGIRKEGGVLLFPTMTPADAAKALEERKKARAQR